MTALVVDLATMLATWERQPSAVKVALNSAWFARDDSARQEAVDAAWAASQGFPVEAFWPAATALPQLPARYAAIGAATRHLLSPHTYRRRHYELLTGPWRRLIGSLHPDDPDLTQPPARPVPAIAGNPARRERLLLSDLTPDAAYS